MPYNLRRYEVTHGDQKVELDLEAMQVRNAPTVDHVANSIAAQVAGAMKKRFVRYQDLTIEEIGEAQRPSGCGCECTACDLNDHHCRSHSRGCYI